MHQTKNRPHARGNGGMIWQHQSGTSRDSAFVVIITFSNRTPSI